MRQLPQRPLWKDIVRPGGLTDGMSSDDVIVVRESKKRDYTVTHTSIEGAVIEDVGDFPSLRDAMLAANKYSRESDFAPEYGIRFVPHSGEPDFVP